MQITGKDVIAAVIANLHAGLEPLQYTVLAPAVFHVYLHPEEYSRLSGVLPRIADEARRALDEEIERMNQPSLAEKLRARVLKSAPARPPVERAASCWQMDFHPDTDRQLNPGDVLVDSELAMPCRAGVTSGNKTKRITTHVSGGHETVRETYEEEPAAAPVSEPTRAPVVYASIRFSDDAGDHEYAVTRDALVVGRGGAEAWVDLRLQTAPDVSRQHLHLRRDAATGGFYLKDVSSLGTTLDGKTVPPGIEIELPRRARIGLAEVVFLEFEAGPG